MQIHTILATLTLDVGNWISWIVFGAFSGYVTGRLIGGRWGYAGDIIIGVIGGLVGWFTLGLFISGVVAWWGTALAAVIGSIILVFLSRAFSGRQYNHEISSSTSSFQRASPPQNVAAKPKQPTYSTSPSIQPASGVVATSLPIFVSHSHVDNAWCRIFVEALKRQGCDVWYDEQGLGGGVIWQKQIVQQLQSRPLFIVVLSPDATASQWVDEEIQLAISSRRKIIPVHHRQTVVEGFLTNRQIVDVRGLDGARAAAIVADAARRLITV